LQWLVGREQADANTVAAPFVGKSSHSNVQIGVLLRCAEHARVKGHFASLCPSPGQVGAHSWLSIGAVHKG
jgi:hypothetical protein